MCHRIISNTTLSFSNVVGPTEEVSLFGSPLIYIAPSVYGHPQVRGSTKCYRLMYRYRRTESMKKTKMLIWWY
ncbi:O-acyltransferase WSD1 [Platanthera zijinensis]|uniref:O-acyltransferase WSD1 n=1 Tax=Platanthera zijinensis TaxID=2320716 RepID=A0AAP0BSZ8_9ASPA